MFLRWLLACSFGLSDGLKSKRRRSCILAYVRSERLNMKTISAKVIFLWLASAAFLAAQSDMRGHWSGSIDTPAGSLVMEVDLDKTEAGWIGSVSIPQQNASGLPLDSISFDGGKGRFRIKGAPGDPTFAGTLSADGKTLDGQFSQGPTSLSLKLNRTGEAKVELIKPSPAVAPEFLGKWEGTLEAGQSLRLVVTISNGKSGAEALLVSVDQGNAQIPVSSITQKGTKLTLAVNAVGGGFEGEISSDGMQLTGTWTQLGNTLQLNLKKAVTDAKP
jgi:hypothetical protein